MATAGIVGAMSQRYFADVKAGPHTRFPQHPRHSHSENGESAKLDLDLELDSLLPQLDALSSQQLISYGVLLLREHPPTEHVAALRNAILEILITKFPDAFLRASDRLLLCSDTSRSYLVRATQHLPDAALHSITLVVQGMPLWQQDTVWPEWLKRFAAVDAQAAWKLAKQIATLPRELTWTAAEAWAGSNPSQAFPDIWNSAAPWLRKQLLNSSVLEDWLRTSGADASAWLFLAMNPASAQTYLAQQGIQLTLEQWRAMSLEDQDAWKERINEQSGLGAFVRSHMAILDALLESPQDAIDTMESLTTVSGKTYAAAAIINNLLSQDPDLALKLALDTPGQRIKFSAFRDYAALAAKENPQDTFEWAKTITELPARSGAMEGALVQWGKQDFVAATRATLEATQHIRGAAYGDERVEAVLLELVIEASRSGSLDADLRQLWDPLTTQQRRLLMTALQKNTAQLPDWLEAPPGMRE